MHIKDFKIEIGDVVFEGSDISQITGLQEMSAEYELVKNATGSGAIVVGSQVPEREMKLVARVKRDVAEHTYRRFKEGNTYEMIIGNRKIDVMVTRRQNNWKNGFYNTPTIELDLFAPDPFFYDVSDFGKDLANTVPLFGFPWEATIEEGFSMGYREFNSETTFTNKGDERVGLKLKIEATGAVRNFLFKNLKTGEYIKVWQELKVGDVMEISTMENEPYIKLNGRDIFDKIDRESIFFTLDVGDNSLAYSADNGKGNMRVYLYYTPKFSSGLEEMEL